MKLNRNFGKLESETLTYAPAILRVVTHHHEEWDEPVLDPETGEPVIDPETGEPVMEHKTREWDTYETKLWPTAEDYHKMGYLEVVDKYPIDPVPEGYHWEAGAYEIVTLQDGTKRIERQYNLVADPPPPPRIFSKLKCVAALMSRNLWDSVKTYVESAGLYDLYLAAQEFKEDNEDFKHGKTALQSALGLTDEQVEEILQESVLY